MSAVDISLFKPELVFFDFEASDRFDFFDKLGAELSAKGYIEDSWFEAIKMREKNYPTGLDCPSIKVAIPHTDPEHLIKPYIAVIKPKQPIVFEGMAGMASEVPTELIVNLGVKAHEESQVFVLQALMKIFLNEGAVKEILAQTTQQGMVDTITKYCEED